MKNEVDEAKAFLDGNVREPTYGITPVLEMYSEEALDVSASFHKSGATNSFLGN